MGRLAAPSAASAIERADNVLHEGWNGKNSLRDAIARAIEQAKREARAAAIEEAALLAERIYDPATSSAHGHGKMIAMAIRALAADNKKPAGAGSGE